MKDDKTPYLAKHQSDALEPRVAKLEVGLDRLTEDVKDLATVVRVQGQTVEQEIQKLVVAVTQAAGPRKTDWSTIIAFLMLIMAIGSAVFWPLSQTSQDTKQRVEQYHDALLDHIKLDNHPVGAAMDAQIMDRVRKLEAQQEKMADEDRQELLLWRQKAMGIQK